MLGLLQPATVRSFDGTAWSDLGNPIGPAERCDEIHSLVTYGGSLHAGTWPLGRVARWDPGRGRWRQAGRLGDSTEVMALNVYNGKLYGAAIPRAEVFRYERDRSWTSLRRLFDPPGWRPVLVRNMSRPPDGDRRMREWTRVTSLTQHDGLLFASVGSCTSAAEDAPADVRGSVWALGAGVVATTPHSLAPGRRHIAAVRRGGALSVFVDGREAAAARGDVSGSVETGAPLRVGEDEAGRYAGAIDGFRAFDRALEPKEIKALHQRGGSDMRRWRVGMVGYGWAAGAHIGALDLIDGFEVAAICTSRELDAAELERAHGRPIEIVRDLDELLARPDIDVIDLCSRSNLHASQAIAAARAGKHLIIEKPVSLSLEDLRAVEEAVRAAGVRTCVCLQVRFSPQFTMTRSLAGGGLIGPVHYAEVDYFHNIGPEVSQYEWNLRSDGGGSSLLTAGCHALDGLLMFMDERRQRGDELRDLVAAPELLALRVPDLVGHDPALRERRARQGGLDRRLAPAVLPARAPGRQRGHDPRRQALVEADRGSRPGSLERARRPAREPERRRGALPPAVPGVRRRARRAIARWR